MRHLRNLLFFFFGVALVAVPMFASAETIPATSAIQTVPRVGVCKGAGAVGYTGGTMNESACVAAVEAVIGAQGYSALQWTDSWSVTAVADSSKSETYTRHFCKYGTNCGWTETAYILGNCQTGTTWDATSKSCLGTVYTCPSTGGWTLSGSTCTRPDCEYGRDENGACITNPCLALAGTANGLYSGSTYSMKVGYDLAPSGLCVDSCVIAFNKDFGGETWTAGKIGNYTGEVCGASGTGDEPAADPENKVNPNTPEKECTDAGKGFGTVNGVVICVNPTAGTPTKKTETEKKTTTTPEGTTTATTTKETTVTKNPDGTTTVTVTITNPDGTTEKTETTTGGTGNGTGGEGDDGDDWGTPTDEGPLPSQSIGPQSITVVDMPTSMNCPNSIALPHGWGEISYQPACDMAGMIRPITLAFAWLAAGLIVIGGFKDS